MKIAFSIKTILGNFVYINEENKSKEIQGKNVLSSTILQIYKQCVRLIFEYGSFSTITASDTIISKIQWLQNKFIRLALHLPKYICIKLLYDSSGLPYVKDRLFSRAAKTLERISANPLVEESISSNRVNPAWDRFLHRSQ